MQFISPNLHLDSLNKFDLVIIRAEVYKVLMAVYYKIPIFCIDRDSYQSEEVRKIIADNSLGVFIEEQSLKDKIVFDFSFELLVKDAKFKNNITKFSKNFTFDNIGRDYVKVVNQLMHNTFSTKSTMTQAADNTANGNLHPLNAEE